MNTPNLPYDFYIQIVQRCLLDFGISEFCSSVTLYVCTRVPIWRVLYIYSSEKRKM